MQEKAKTRVREIAPPRTEGASRRDSRILAFASSSISVVQSSPDSKYSFCGLNGNMEPWVCELQKSEETYLVLIRLYSNCGL